MGDRGRVVVPLSLRTKQEWSQGTNLIFIETQSGAFLTSREQAKSLLRKQLAGESLVDELIAQRHHEALGDDNDGS